jgi:amino acid permease
MSKKSAPKRTKKAVSIAAVKTSAPKPKKEELKMPLLVWFLSVLSAPVLLLMVPVYFGEALADYSQMNGAIWGSLVMTVPSIILAFVVSLALNKEYFENKKDFAGISRMAFIIATVMNIFVLMSMTIIPELFA